jgi:hypothetical protein
MDKIDFKKDLKELYNPSSKEVSTVNVPNMNFLMVDGKGNPNTSQSYREAIEALFSVSYTLKFLIKKTKNINYAVMPLEGLWWVDDMAKFSAERKEEWKWTAMIMQPQFVTTQEVKASIENAREKKNLPALSKIKFQEYNEGLAAQIMYIGPYSAEGPTIQRIHAFIQEKHTLKGKHHEIYLSDPNRTKPEKLKTIIRQSME